MIYSLNGTSGNIRMGPWPLLATSATYAIMVKFTALPASFCGLLNQNVGGGNTIQGGMYMNSNGRASFINQAASQDAPVGHAITAGNWYIIVMTKTAGTTIPRSHLCPLSTGTWVHADCGGTVANPSLGTSPGTLRIGQFEAGNFGNFKVAAASVWNIALSDFEVGSLTSGGFVNAWKVQTGAQKTLVEFNQVTPAPDASGSGNPELSRVGVTLVTTDEPTNTTRGLPSASPHIDNLAPRLAFSGTAVGLPDPKSTPLKNNGTGALDWATTLPAWAAANPATSVAAGGSLGTGLSTTVFIQPTPGLLTAPTQVLYVSPSGSDSNDGLSASTPLATLARADVLATPGTDIYVAPGNYPATHLTKSGTVNARIRWISTSKWGAIIPAGTWWLADYIDTIDFQCTGGIAVDGLVVDGNFSRVIGALVHHVSADGNLGPGGSGILLGGAVDYTKHNIEAINCVVHDIIDTTNTWSSHVHAIYINVPDCVVRNNVVYDCSGIGIHYWHASKRGLTISNTVNNCNEGVLLGQGDSGADSPTPTHNGAYVVNNVLTNCHAKGVDEQSSAHENFFYHNTLFGNADNTLVPHGTGSETGTITSDPQYVNAAAKNFRIPDASPSANTGVAIVQTAPFDADWKLRDVSAPIAPNRGAFESATSGVLAESPGFYESTVSFTSVGGDNSPQSFGFTLLVVPPAASSSSGVVLPIASDSVSTIDEIPLTEEFTTKTGEFL